MVFDVTGISVEDLATKHPRLYHMAADGSWPSIREHGLLSTVSLLELFEVSSAQAMEITGHVRRRSFTIQHPEHGQALVRDQLPAKFLDRCITPGTTAFDFLESLNNRVFFWLSEERLVRLLGARAYRKAPQIVLELDTAVLLAQYGSVAELAPYNTGSMHVPTAPIRDATVFQSLASYPWDDWRHKRGAKQEAAVELTIPSGVSDVANYVRRVRRWVDGIPTETIFGPIT